MMAEVSARLCILRKWPDFQGFGFNLHGEKNKSGHFIGTVESDSPAKSSGLEKGDRVIEVNGTNVTNRSHNDVVVLIRNSVEQVALLVMSEEMEQTAIEQGLVVTSSDSNVTIIRATDSLAEYQTTQEAEKTDEVAEEPVSAMSAEEQRKYEEEVADSVAAAAEESEVAPEPEEPSEEAPKSETPEPPALAAEPEPAAEPELQPAPVAEPEPQPAPAAVPTANGGGSSPAMSAAEFRAQLSKNSKKKGDPRQSGATFRDKTLLFQQM